MINLSLGTIFEEDFDILHRVCKELFLGGCKIIAAENNYEEISAPACFEEVISVQRTKIGHILMYNRRKRKVTVSGRRQLTDLEGDTFFCQNSNSYACAYASCVLSKKRGKKIIYDTSKKNIKIIWV